MRGRCGGGWGGGGELPLTGLYLKYDLSMVTLSNKILLRFVSFFSRWVHFKNVVLLKGQCHKLCKKNENAD